jgi:hypothetical protein
MQIFIADKLSLSSEQSEQLNQLLDAFRAGIPKELKGRLPRCA